MLRRRSRRTSRSTAEEFHDHDDSPAPIATPARWLVGPVSRVRCHISLVWPLRTGQQYRECSEVALVGDVLFEPRTLHVELLAPAAFAPHHLAQAHAQVRKSLDDYIWQVGTQGLELWPEAVHLTRSSGQWYSALPWCLIDPTEEGQRRLAEQRRFEKRLDAEIAANRKALGLPSLEDSDRPSIPTHCPRCATPTVHDERARIFRCPSCAWHD